MPTKAIDIVFDGPPGPEGPRFVEVEYHQRYAVWIGEWIDRGDGYWALRFTAEDLDKLWEIVT